MGDIAERADHPAITEHAQRANARVVRKQAQLPACSATISSMTARIRVTAEAGVSWKSSEPSSLISSVISTSRGSTRTSSVIACAVSIARKYGLE
ncbi:MAG: hypothetical protein E6I96_05175 [Chloroflexi bacterium]|nr:MAG: hypothetical protein E6I96_05175 [Chloroflexota bacterium]